jgi:hypothetical protein
LERAKKQLITEVSPEAKVEKDVDNESNKASDLSETSLKSDEEDVA